MARDFASPVGSVLPPGSVTLGFIPGQPESAASSAERDPASPPPLVSLGSALDDPAPATAAALALTDALESWSVAVAPAAANPPEPSSTPEPAHAGTDSPADSAAVLPDGIDAPADASEGLALALWHGGRRDEAIQVLEQGIALGKQGEPAGLAPAASANGNAGSTAVAAASSAPAPRRRFRQAAAVALLAGAAFLLSWAALWSGRNVPAGELAEPRPQIASDAVQADGNGASAPITARAGELRPAADVPDPPPVLSKPPAAETVAVPQPTRADDIAPARGVMAKPVPELRQTTPALAVEEAAPPREVRVPKGRPALPATEASAPRAPAAPATVQPAQRRASAAAEPGPAARDAGQRRPPGSRAPRLRLAEQRAAAERYAARRRAAAERASARSDRPSILLGRGGLP